MRRARYWRICWLFLGKDFVGNGIGIAKRCFCTGLGTGGTQGLEIILDRKERKRECEGESMVSGIMDYTEDKPGEECGVFGAYDFDGGDVSHTIYYGLLALQHRGQESCGIAVSDTQGPKGKVLSSKDMGDRKSVV